MKKEESLYDVISGKNENWRFHKVIKYLKLVKYLWKCVNDDTNDTQRKLFVNNTSLLLQFLLRKVVVEKKGLNTLPPLDKELKAKFIKT